MKRQILSTIVASAIATSATASTTREENQNLLNRLQANRTSTLWNCKKNGNDEALVMFTVDNSVSSLLSGSQILAVQDERICGSLRVTCPFVASVFEGTFGLTGPVRYGYWSTRGRNEDTLMFFSDGQGMKAVSVSNGSRPSAMWDFSWYFNPGECVLH